MLYCDPKRRLPDYAIALIVISGVITLMALSATLYYTSWFGMGHRPVVFRLLANARKRIKGAPTHVSLELGSGGPISVYPTWPFTFMGLAH